MSAGLVSALLRQLRPRPTGSDGELLRRFTAQHDEAAFEELLTRHGPLVWGVCRRALPNRADVEDAFQATFLILAQRAHGIRKPDSLGCWLHGVAYRVSRRMRGQSLRTSPNIGSQQPAHTEAPIEGPTVREFLAALDEELARLPEKYRAPLVLCYLREQTRDEAARQLGLSLSTLKRRLETARERLRVRLARRGVELPATLAATALAGTVSSSVASATLRAAVVGPAGVVSANVLTVTEGVVRAMWEMKLRAWAAGVFMATAAVGGSGYFITHTGAAQPGGTGDGPAASDKPATGEKPAAPKPSAENLSNPLARTKRLRELLNTIARKAALVDHFLHRFKGTPSERKTQMERAVTELTEAKKQFDRIAAMGPIAWDKSVPADPDVRTQVQRALADAAFKSWQGWDSNRNQPNSLDAM